MNEVIRQLHARKSVRVFTDREITPEEKRAVLEAAVQAPSAGNQQLYTILDITDQSIKDKLVDTCDHQPMIAEAKMVLIFCADCKKWYDAYVATDCNPRKPGVGDLLLAVCDTVIAAQNAVIVSGIDIPFGVKPGSELITNAFATVLGDRFASLFVAIALMLFAFSTILGWSLYGSRCVEYLFGMKATGIYQVIFIVMIVVGATTSLDIVWDVADTFNGLMAIPNFIALFGLSGVVTKQTKEYFAKQTPSLKQ